MRLQNVMVAVAGAVVAAALPAAAKTPKVAEKPAAACPANPVLPPDLVDWARGSSGKTIYAYGDARAADWVPLGAARTGLLLHKYESLKYWVAPDRTPDDHKFGGMIPVEVKRAGRLVVALDAGAWIDLVREGVKVKSVVHGHGPECSGIRKMVEFDVKPGRYLLQIVNAPAVSIRAMAVMR